MGAPVGVATAPVGMVLAVADPVAVTMVAGQTVVLTMTVEVTTFWVSEAGQLGTEAAQLVMVYMAVLVTVLVTMPALPPALGAEVTLALP
jgi:hypothetical protein